jgi:hypothetical protein
MADSGPARQLGKPGKRALCSHGHGHGHGQQGEVAGKQQKTHQANKNVADFYVAGVLSTMKRGKIKWWKLYIIFVELESHFLDVVTVNDTENRTEIACVLCAFHAWWFHFPQLGALAKGTSRPTSCKHDQA